MEYQTIAETALRWGISRKRVQVLCAGGRIPGAVRLGRMWAIPAGAQKPADPRRRPAEERGKGQ